MAIAPQLGRFDGSLLSDGPHPALRRSRYVGAGQGTCPEIVEAILKRPVASPAHLVDLAIVARFRGDEPTDKLEDHEAALAAMVSILLQAAGIARSLVLDRKPGIRRVSSDASIEYSGENKNENASDERHDRR